MIKIDDVSINVSACSPVVSDARGNLFQACYVDINDVSHSVVVMNDRLIKIDNQSPISFTGKIAKNITSKEGAALGRKEIGTLLKRIEFMVTPTGLKKARYKSLSRELEYLKHEQKKRKTLDLCSKEYESLSDKDLNLKIISNIGAMIRLKEDAVRSTIVV